jgi:hypothetical protein
MITATWIVDDVVTMPQPEQMLAIEMDNGVLKPAKHMTGYRFVQS